MSTPANEIDNKLKQVKNTSETTMEDRAKKLYEQLSSKKIQVEDSLRQAHQTTNTIVKLGKEKIVDVASKRINTLNDTSQDKKISEYEHIKNRLEKKAIEYAIKQLEKLPNTVEEITETIITEFVVPNIPVIGPTIKKYGPKIRSAL